MSQNIKVVASEQVRFNYSESAKKGDTEIEKETSRTEIRDDATVGRVLRLGTNKSTRLNVLPVFEEEFLERREVPLALDHTCSDLSISISTRPRNSR